MSIDRTGASSNYEDSAPQAKGDAKDERPGLILLFARNFATLAGAYPFSSSELTIGRDLTNAICIPEQAVSRTHARIVQNGNRWIVEDLGSRNGTLVDGSYITTLELESGHELRVGDAIFKFVSAGAQRAATYRIDGTFVGEHRKGAFHELVGGATIGQTAMEIERIAPTALSAIILGETGTGKEVVARGLHRLSGRRGTFQAIHCAAIPHNLLESELFGYRRGAFSGADRDKPGLIKLADHGTLFLDEIGDMPLDAQAKLLRVLQTREVFPLGATAAEAVDIRVVCATHRDLYQYEKEGKFRGDLLARLHEHVVHLPPLRDRKEDIYLLAKTFCARYGRPNIEFQFSFLVALFHYDWPFNVRELESCIKRAVALTNSDVLDTAQLPLAVSDCMKTYGSRPDAAAVKAEAALSPPIAVAHGRARAPSEGELRALLERHQGNVAAVGRELGKERMQIHRWLKRYGINLAQYRKD
jgi:transcriptional regulator with GAF, ATPase, and Fis domain